MPESVVKAVPHTIGYLKRKLERVPKGKTVLIVGVGNTVGVGDSKKDLTEAYEKIHKNAAKMKKLKAEEEQKKKWWKK